MAHSGCRGLGEHAPGSGPRVLDPEFRKNTGLGATISQCFCFPRLHCPLCKCMKDLSGPNTPGGATELWWNQGLVISDHLIILCHLMKMAGMVYIVHTFTVQSGRHVSINTMCPVEVFSRCFGTTEQKITLEDYVRSQVDSGCTYGREKSLAKA